MGDEDDAKDVMQDAFINAFTTIKMLKNPETFPAWIKRIVVNHCINALKKKKFQMVMIDEGVDLADDLEIPDDQFEYEVRKVLNAIDQISDGCKVVLNLYLFEGYDHKEIAQILSISESGSKAQYSKAKMKIRKILMTEN